MPSIEHYGHYDSGFEDVLEERVAKAWNSNTTFSERAFAEATNMGCLDCMTNRCGKCSTHFKTDKGGQERDIDTFKCIPMRPPLNPNPDLDHHEVGRIFNPKYEDPRYIRPDIPIPDDYAPDPNGFVGPVDFGDFRPGYKAMDLLGDGGCGKPRSKRRRSKPVKKSNVLKTTQTESGPVVGEKCDLENVELKEIAGCTMETLENVVSDFQHWDQVPGSNTGKKLQYIFSTDDRPFYLGLTVVFLILAALILKLVWGLFDKPTSPQRGYIMM